MKVAQKLHWYSTQPGFFCFFLKHEYRAFMSADSISNDDFAAKVINVQSVHRTVYKLKGSF